MPMDELSFCQGYVDAWLQGREKVSHKRLRDAYRRAKKLHEELYGEDGSAPYFGFCEYVGNEFDEE